MQVLCINSGLHITKNGLVNDASEFLTESEKYTVIDIVENKLGEVWYVLEEVSSPSKLGSFSDTRFIPCFGKDEEIFNNNKTQIYESITLR